MKYVLKNATYNKLITYQNRTFLVGEISMKKMLKFHIVDSIVSIYCISLSLLKFHEIIKNCY